MSERVNGLEHPYTITEYTHLALYCFANTQVLLPAVKSDIKLNAIGIGTGVYNIITS
jgi:hypothetical protein